MGRSITSIRIDALTEPPEFGSYRVFCCRLQDAGDARNHSRLAYR